MKGVFLGSDFMYRQDGKLVPIEINTNVATDAVKRVESNSEWVDVSALAAFVQEHSVSELFIEGNLAEIIFNAIEAWTGPEFENVHKTRLTSLEDLEQIQDEEGVLAIRTSYSDEALVDAYCRDKIDFLKLNANEDFGQSFTHNNSGTLEGAVDLVDNGNHPNLIVKYRYPQYAEAYPKLLRFETQEEVEAWAKDNLEEDYYISPFLYNENNLLETLNGKRLKVIRHIAVLVVVDEELKSVPVGAYTKWCNADILENPSLDMYEDGVLKQEYRRHYLSKHTLSDSLGSARDLLADADDEILMADGTWKKASEIVIGDRVRSLKVEGKGGADIHNHTVDYNESLEDFEAETEFEEAEVLTAKGPVEGYADYVRFEFEDGTSWADTAASSYLVIDPEDGTVRFQDLDKINVGDTILILDATEVEKPVYVQKVVVEVSQEREWIQGYGLALDGSHIFLSREPGLPEMFASIEHNPPEGVCGGTCLYDMSTGALTYMSDYGCSWDTSTSQKACDCSPSRTGSCSSVVIGGRNYYACSGACFIG